MTSYYYIALSIAALAPAALGVRYTLHMFQQGSYQYRSYWRYMKSHPVMTLLPLTGMIPLACWVWCLAARGRWGLFLMGLVIPLMELVYLVMLVLVYRPRKAKKKLVFTARVKRLTATTAVLYLLAALLAGVLGGWIGLWMLAVAGVMLSPYMVLLANLINQPIERGINRYYIRDARRMLKACPQLKSIGITGSYGKTSVKYYLETLLGAQYDVLMTPESFNTPMGVVKTIRGACGQPMRFFCARWEPGTWGISRRYAILWTRRLALSLPWATSTWRPSRLWIILWVPRGSCSTRCPRARPDL